MGLNVLNQLGKKIHLVDCSLETEATKEDVITALEAASVEISKLPKKSALVITNVSNTKFNNAVFDAFKAYAHNNTEYVKASSIVGLSGMQKIMFSAIQKLTNRDIFIANDIEAAKKYLLSK